MVVVVAGQVVVDAGAVDVVGAGHGADDVGGAIVVVLDVEDVDEDVDAGTVVDVEDVDVVVVDVVVVDVVDVVVVELVVVVGGGGRTGVRTSGPDTNWGR